MKLLEWAADERLQTVLIEPGKPWQNGTDERFNGKFRDECLSMECFREGLEARTVIEDWRRHYNEVRPHSSLSYLTPSQHVCGIEISISYTGQNLQLAAISKKRAGQDCVIPAQ